MFDKRRGILRRTWRVLTCQYRIYPYSNPFYNTWRWQLVRLVSFWLFGTRCLDCGTPGDSTNPITVDHCIPLSWPSGKKYRWDPRRTQPRCWDDNTAKGARAIDDIRPGWAQRLWPLDTSF
jgi:hypothetical protein